jgi:hypothetical protein
VRTSSQLATPTIAPLVSEAPEEAKNALARAEQNGDASLSRAIALRAFNESGSGPLADRAWGDVLRSYSGPRYGVAEDVTALADLSANSLERGMIRGMMLSVTQPSELRGFNADHLAAQE